MPSVPVWKVEPCLQPPVVPWFWPRLIVEVYFGWPMSDFSISPTYRQQAHDIASHRHTHDSRGSPDSGNSHVFSRLSSHSFAPLPKMASLSSQVRRILGQGRSKHWQRNHVLRSTRAKPCHTQNHTIDVRLVLGSGCPRPRTQVVAAQLARRDRHTVSHCWAHAAVVLP